ncbi:MAG: glycosyl transferase family protein [Acidobacteriota bacterium]
MTFPILAALDQGILAILGPLAAAILISGIDDLFVDAAWALSWLKSKLRPAASLFPPGPRQLESAPRAPIAIFLPLWQEHEVIAQMLQHNLASIRYPEYHIFAGCYPNDAATQQAVQAVASGFPNVHVAVCPHDGPTSKADCLNWIYQHMLLYEEQSKIRFAVVVTHDAEDLIHPEELSWINYYAARYDFVQTPVLPLATPFSEWTHGVYCDEFAEYHTRDMTVRASLGGFVPSCGVGTGYRREALVRLAESSSNHVFEPEALTEDYDNGLRLKRLGCRQAFVPIAPHGTADFVATREFFPRSFRAALRQRTRWVMGISLQSWEKFGWSGTLAETYWLWRDRKGLLTNPLSALANLVFFYGLLTAVWNRAAAGTIEIAKITLALLCLRTVIRMGCVARIYGVPFALGVPLRAVYANVLNAAATFAAVGRFGWARWHGYPLTWLKTEHAYPHRSTLLGHKRRLGEILISGGYLDAATIERAVASCPVGVRLGEHLVHDGHLSMDTLYTALGFQQGLPIARVDASAVSSGIAHALPERFVREWAVLPFRVEQGALFLASPEAPTAAMTGALTTFTRLETRFHLVTPAEFENLAAALL